jgi:Mn2+/Fe2+ NRAMP family transporter
MNTKHNDTPPPAPNSHKKSLEEVHGTVETQHPKLWKRIFAFAGPAYLVSAGYMDPGNWATDLAGGSRFGYALIWVILVSNMMAVLLQTLAARLGIITGKNPAALNIQNPHHLLSGYSNPSLSLSIFFSASIP